VICSVELLALYWGAHARSHLDGTMFLVNFQSERTENRILFSESEEVSLMKYTCTMFIMIATKILFLDHPSSLVPQSDVSACCSKDKFILSELIAIPN
jgi:hypothetical protein